MSSSLPSIFAPESPVQRLRRLAEKCGYTSFFNVVCKVSGWSPAPLHQPSTPANDADVLQLWERLKWPLIVGDLKAFAVVPGYGVQEIGAGDWAAVTTHGPPGQMLWRSAADRITVCPLLRDEDIAFVSRIWTEMRGLAVAVEPSAGPVISVASRSKGGDNECQRDRKAIETAFKALCRKEIDTACAQSGVRPGKVFVERVRYQFELSRSDARSLFDEVKAEYQSIDWVKRGPKKLEPEMGR